jgi:enoyl-[acyl-carrier protein] reductase III
MQEREIMSDMTSWGEDDWALILGASSGFGEAAAVELATLGLNIFGVHLDRKSTLPNAERIALQIRSLGREVLFFNANAADPEKRADLLRAMKQRGEESGKPVCVRVFLHSLAFGTLKPYIAESHAEAINKAQMDMTLDVMANSLVYWTQDLVAQKFLKAGSRIFSMTSAGGARVWRTYGAVSAAKAALESHSRQLALELAPLGITVNALMAGVTDTPALRKIPGSDEMLALAKRKNPSNRLTTPKDVADALGLLSHPKAHWMTGNVICVDGGEFIVD